VKVRGQGGFNVDKVKIELRYRKIDVPDKVTTEELKVLLEKKCELAGFKGYFRFTMPESEQELGDELREAQTAKKARVKQIAAKHDIVIAEGVTSARDVKAAVLAGLKAKSQLQ